MYPHGFPHFVGEPNNDQSPAGEIPLRMDRTPSMELYFIDLMIDQVQRGNKVTHTFTEQAWADMIESFNGKFGLQCSKNFLEDWYICLMKQYDDISSILNRSGFMWDESQQMVTAENNVWEDYVKVHSSLSANANVVLLGSTC